VRASAERVTVEISFSPEVFVAMKMIVISNAVPLIALAKVERFNLISKMVYNLTREKK
jgi:hypothetical protein